MTPTDWPVFPGPFHAGLVTRRYFDAWDFYTERLGFRTVDEGGSWVRLVHPSGGQLVLMQEETNEQLAELVAAVEPRGLWLTRVVADPAARAGELRAGGGEAEASAPGGPGGRDAWTLRDPDGVTILLSRRAGGVRRAGGAVVAEGSEARPAPR